MRMKMKMKKKRKRWAFGPRHGSSLHLPPLLYIR
jgi:hypothetical protein